MYILNNRNYDEDPKSKLGSGSEGTIYPFPDDQKMCVKIFHADSNPTPEELKMAKVRAEKVKRICKSNLNLPEQFIIALEPAYNDHNLISGFMMRRMQIGFVKIMELLKDFRIKYEIDMGQISLLFASIFDDLAILRSKRIVVGDINTGCLMINSKLERAWVDTDSWGFPKFHCFGTTELFCHPDLYPNLSSSTGNFVKHEAHHDVFSFVVMYVLMALRGAHPFRMGLHQQYTSLQERAKAGVTIFDKGVRYPKVLPSLDLLSDDLLNQIIPVLKRKVKEFNPEALLEFVDGLVLCPECGVQYHMSRKHCPTCHEKTIVDLSRLLKLIINDKYFRTTGAILFVQNLDNVLHIVCKASGKLYLVKFDEHDRKTIIETDIEIVAGASYRFFDSCLVVCEEPYAREPVELAIYEIANNQVARLTTTTTGILENSRVIFDSSSKFLYRTAGNTLLCCKLFGGGKLLEQEVTQIYKSQTWFTVDRAVASGREVVFGYDRMLRDNNWFIIHGTEDGEKFSYYDVDFKKMRKGEKLIDFAIYFNRTSVLLVRKTEYRGKECIRCSIVDLQGQIVADKIIEDIDPGYEYWQDIGGKFYQKSGVLHVTAEGIIKQSFKDDSYTPIIETKQLVTLGDKLFQFNKMIGVVNRSRILTVKKK